MGLRDRLARKREKTTYHDVALVSSEEQDALADAYTEARRAHAAAERKNGEDSEQAAAAHEAVLAARQDIADASLRLTFRNLAPDVYEALVALHPPTKEQQADGDQWNRDTFTPALLAACAVDSDLSEQDWIDELSKDTWSAADRSALFLAAFTANVTPRSLTVPKG